MTGRYVPEDRHNRGRINGCAWCGWNAGNPGTSHELATCLACGIPQCKSHPECRACLVGWLPGYWRGGPDRHDCGYKGCSSPAVAKAPRVGRVCADHLARVKDRGQPLADVIAAARWETLYSRDYSTRWRRMVWLPAVGHENDPAPDLPAIVGATWEPPHHCVDCGMPAEQLPDTGTWVHAGTGRVWCTRSVPPAAGSVAVQFCPPPVTISAERRP